MSNKPIISIYSFGFNYGGVDDANIIYDVSFLESPKNIKEYSNSDGLDQRVKEWILKNNKSQEFIEKFSKLLRETIAKYFNSERYNITIAVGSDEGKHRAPVIVHEIASNLEDAQWRVVEWHRDILKK